MRQRALTVLKKKGVDVRLRAAVTRLEEDRVHLADGSVLGTHAPIWVAGVKPQVPDFDHEPAKDKGGRLLVKSDFTLEGDDRIYALGDAAAYLQDHAPLPALAQVATKQAKALADALAARIRGNRSACPFHFVSSGSLVSLGRWSAIAEIGSLRFGGRLAWWIWRTVYLSKLISWQKKLQVALDWTIDAFSSRDISKV